MASLVLTAVVIQLAQRSVLTSALTPAPTGPAGVPGPPHLLHATQLAVAKLEHATDVIPIIARDLLNAVKMLSTPRNLVLKKPTFCPVFNVAIGANQTAERK